MTSLTPSEPCREIGGTDKAQWKCEARDVYRIEGRGLKLSRGGSGSFTSQSDKNGSARIVPVWRRLEEKRGEGQSLLLNNAWALGSGSGVPSGRPAKRSRTGNLTMRRVQDRSTVRGGRVWLRGRKKKVEVAKFKKEKILP